MRWGSHEFGEAVGAVASVDELVLLESASRVDRLSPLRCLLLVHSSGNIVLQKVGDVFALKEGKKIGKSEQQTQNQEQKSGWFPYMFGFTDKSGLVGHVSHLHSKVGLVAAPVADFVEPISLQHDFCRRVQN